MEHPVLTKEDLKRVEAAKKPFYRKKTLSDKKEYNIFQYNEYMRFNRAMTFDGTYWSICNLSLYLKLDNELEQLSKYHNKVAYAKQKDLERLAESAS